jgi:hypothetical protein
MQTRFRDGIEIRERQFGVPAGVVGAKAVAERSLPYLRDRCEQPEQARSGATLELEKIVWERSEQRQAVCPVGLNHCRRPISAAWRRSRLAIISLIRCIF